MDSSPDIERLLYGESEGVIKSRAVEVERMRLAYGSSLERKTRMQALQAKREKSLQALQGALTRPELSSKASCSFSQAPLAYQRKFLHLCAVQFVPWALMQEILYGTLHTVRHARRVSSELKNNKMHMGRRVSSPMCASDHLNAVKLGSLEELWHVFVSVYQL